MDRFSVPQEIKAIVNKAIEIELIDGLEAMCLGAKFGSDFEGLANEILDYAWSNRNSQPEHHWHIATLFDNWCASPLRAVNKAAAG